MITQARTLTMGARDVGSNGNRRRWRDHGRTCNRQPDRNRHQDQRAAAPAIALAQLALPGALDRLRHVAARPDRGGFRLSGGDPPDDGLTGAGRRVRLSSDGGQHARRAAGRRTRRSVGPPARADGRRGCPGDRDRQRRHRMAFRPPHARPPLRDRGGPGRDHSIRRIGTDADGPCRRSAGTADPGAHAGRGAYVGRRPGWSAARWRTPRDQSWSAVRGHDVDVRGLVRHGAHRAGAGHEGRCGSGPVGRRPPRLRPRPRPTTACWPACVRCGATVRCAARC